MSSFKKIILGAVVIGAIVLIATGISFGESNKVGRDKVAEKFDQTPAIKGKYSLNGASVKMPAKEKDGVEIEVGDPAGAELTPDLKISRWNGEVSLKLKPNIVNVAQKDKDFNFEGEKIKYTTPEAEYHFYDKSDVSPEGGYEFEVVYNQRPASNIVEIPIETQNLDFLYQSPLNEETWGENIVSCTETQCFYADGQVAISRPENVVGSYAVYHKTKSNYIVGQTNYKTGKAFHIYRPKIIDAGNNWVWGQLNIDVINNKLTVTVPQNFLDSAAYPVIVDPTFGYTTIGTTGTGNPNYHGSNTTVALKLEQTSPAAANNTLNSISIYWNPPYSGSGGNESYGFYSDSSGEPSSRLAQDTAVAVVVATPDWYTNPSDLNYTLAASTQYWVAIGDTQQYGVTTYFDDGGAGTDRYGGAATLPDPWSGASSDYSSKKISAYVTYTEPATPADLTWATGAADFEIYATSTLAWDNGGTPICSGALSDDNNSTINCYSGSISPSTQYRVQVVLKNTGGTAINMNGASEYVSQVNVKGGWAGSSPTLGTCGFYDVDSDNGATTCTLGWNNNNASTTNTGAGNVVIAATTGSEGFMYMITTDNNVGRNASSYLDTSIDSISENSSKINIGSTRAIKIDASLKGRWPTGLVGHWTFDGPDVNWSTGVVLDVSGQGNNGVVNNMSTSSSPIKGEAGQAFKFDGTNDYIDRGAGPTSVKTILFWVYPTTTTEYFVNLTADTDYIWANAGTITAQGITGTIYVDGAVSSAISAAKWQLVAVTTETAENASNFDIGRTQDANYMDGMIDEVRLYNRALSADEILEIYNASAASYSMKIAPSQKNYMPTGLVGHWTFDGPDVNWATGVVSDVSGQGNNGVAKSMSTSSTPRQGKVGQGLDFDGTNDYVDTQKDFSWTVAQSFSLSLWFKTDTTASYQVLISKSSYEYSLYIDTANGGTLRFIYWNAAGSNQIDLNSNRSGTVPLVAGKWYHAVITYGGSNNAYMYLDNVQIDSDTTVGALRDIANTTYIGYGYYPGGSLYYFNGLIDEVRFYSRVLSSSEIQQLYNLGSRKTRL